VPWRSEAAVTTVQEADRPVRGVSPAGP
jgi:hypothetical protein